jgi:hypothetical protein
MEEKEEPSILDKIKQGLNKAVEKAKDVGNTILDKIKDILGISKDNADDTADNDNDDGEEDEELSDAERLFGERFKKPQSLLDLDPDWGKDPDIQEWNNQSTDDFLNDGNDPDGDYEYPEDGMD